MLIVHIYLWRIWMITWAISTSKLVPSAIHIHPYLYWLFIELMDKWHWTSPRQIKVEKTVIYSFSLFEIEMDWSTTLVFLSVSMCVSWVVFLCVSVCLLSMCEATVCLLSLWVRGLSQGQFTKLVGPRDRGWLPSHERTPSLKPAICISFPCPNQMH